MSSDSGHESRRLRVAAIMDAFTYNSFKPDCELVQLSPANWIHELVSFEPDLLFVESAWRGKDDLWDRKIAHASFELIGIVEWCRDHEIPTAFWNKEDPIHFNTFLNTAARFDYVFTTDLDCIHRYKAALGHERVYLLPFACQPRIFNPMELGPRIDAFCFAGAYYTRYPERARDLRNMIKGLTQIAPFVIYDRNAGSEDPNYSFPLEFAPFILGSLPFEQVDRAYKGYRYAVNLNSVKQSQTMCARRVFELLASNSIVVGNYARSIKLMFGDLVFGSDSALWTAQRLAELVRDDSALRKLRLAGLRKVLQGHTYEDRLRYLWSKVTGGPGGSSLCEVLAISFVRHQSDVERAIANFLRQSYTQKRLLIVTDDSFDASGNALEAGVTIWSRGRRDTFGESEIAAEYVAGMAPEDYYGPNYLLDLALATRFSSASIIGKGSYYTCGRPGTGPVLVESGHQYTQRTRHSARRALIRGDFLDEVTITDWASQVRDLVVESDDAVSVDEFNYCEDAGIHRSGSVVAAAVDDLPDLDVGMEIGEILSRAETVPPTFGFDDGAVLGPDSLAAWFGASGETWCSITKEAAVLEVESRLPDERHAYVYSERLLAAAELGLTGRAGFFLDAGPGLDVQIALLFLNDREERLGSVVLHPNSNHDVVAPEGTALVRPGLRIRGSGRAAVNGLVLGHRQLEPPEILGRGEQLLVTNQYPSYEDLYRNAFVHRRVLAYRNAGLDIDVFRFRSAGAISYHEFENVDCITGSQTALVNLLESGRYKGVLVHFLSETMWDVLEEYADRMPITVWIHGAEIQPWYRRSFLYSNEDDLLKAKEQSQGRTDFWRRVFSTRPANVRFVFVSQYLADEVMQDVGVVLPVDSYEVIHNPVDTVLFQYRPKPAEQRRKLLSIRPFATPTYANDLTVKAILELTNEEWFGQLDIRIIGQGPLFDETVEPLRGLPNVALEKRFMRQSEIASLHQQYGVFLCPTRTDTQGVSRDEAMSSGLVPITNAVAAVPEFVDESCGISVPPEDHLAIADGIRRLIEDPDYFLKLSVAASRRVRRQSALDSVISQELALIGDPGCPGA